MDYRDESRIELAEVTPGVFLPKHATEFTSQTGAVAKKDSRAGWGRCDMETDRIEVGDVKYAADLFELSSLPVPKDVHITDHRGGGVVESGGKSVDIEAALLAAGKPAPPFEVSLLAGGGFKSKDVIGAKKHLLVTFWSCACPPCAAELAYLGEIHGDLQGAAIEVIAVNLGDEPDDVRKYVKDHSLKLPVGLGGDKFDGSKVGTAYGVYAIPTTYLISPEGNMLWRNTGFDRDKLIEALKKAGYSPKGSGN